jgi:hypothetical protein
MHIKVFCLTLSLIFFPMLGTYAGLDLYFSDTTPPSPLTNDVLPVDGIFTIDVIADAPVGTVAAVDFNVTWTPAANVDYIQASAGGFFSSAAIVAIDSNTPGSQTVGVTTTGGANLGGSAVLATLSFAKRTGDGSVRFDFSNISALDLSFQPVTPVSGVPSSDITLPVALSSLSAEASPFGVTLRWHTMHEVDNAGFNVLRSASRDGEYRKLNERLIEGRGTSAVPHDYQYIDSAVTAGNTYYYRVEAVDLLGGKSPSRTIKLEVTEDALNPPEASELGQNYPNPGNPDTWIPYALALEAEAKIEIYNMTGRLMRTLELGHKLPGRYASRAKAAHWDGKTSAGELVPSGVYFYVLKAGSFIAGRKLVMLK